jgi:hypothetical protein
MQNENIKFMYANMIFFLIIFFVFVMTNILHERIAVAWAIYCILVQTLDPQI